MTLILSIILGLFPLAGLVWMILYRSLATVDGLFMTLILLTASAVLFFNAFLEMKTARSRQTQTRK